MIPARNVRDMQRRRLRAQQHTEAIWYLAERYRAGKLTAEDLTSAEREAVMVWLLDHRRPQDRVA